MKMKIIFSWVLRVLVAIIFVQTLFFKFTGHPDSIYIFSMLGVEPYGRIGVGIIELIVSVIILVPRTKALGILLSLGVVSGAIFSHLLVLGTEVKEDGGGLFTLALVILTACIGLFFIHKNEVQLFIKSIFGKWATQNQF